MFLGRKGLLVVMVLIRGREKTKDEVESTISERKVIFRVILNQQERWWRSPDSSKAGSKEEGGLRVGGSCRPRVPVRPALLGVTLLHRVGAEMNAARGPRFCGCTNLHLPDN